MFDGSDFLGIPVSAHRPWRLDVALIMVRRRDRRFLKYRPVPNRECFTFRAWLVASVDLGGVRFKFQGYGRWGNLTQPPDSAIDMR